ncbi:MAG: PH domain-containing protein [Gammaproteobacteria bacterium]|nr:PH domain-containing protein [Gammaproteobacteria bacterium]MDH3416651.1 PH domain-containing protein [Gammaproteobacteria bacterium]
MFQNPEIPPSELPGADDIQWQALDPAYKRLRRLQNSIGILAAAVPLVTVTVAAKLPVLPVVALSACWVVFSVLLLIWPGISLPKRGYVLRDKDILFRKGVIWRSVTAIPFNRIQHVETSSTPFDRKFDLATLQLFTAGGSGGDLKIDGLSTATAEQLRVFILEKAGASIENS